MNIGETVPGDDGFQSFMALFERYRADYGQAADRDRTQAWLTNTTTTGPMRAFVGRLDGGAAGIRLIAICPPSLRRRGALDGPRRLCRSAVAWT
jgi:hypothetical protein